MKKWDILTNIFVEKLIFSGKWLAKTDDGKKIIINWWVIPESTVSVRVLKNRSNHIEAQVLDVEKKSPLEEELPAHFQVYGGCKWLPIKYEKQLEIKETQIRESFNALKDKLQNTTFHPIVASPDIYGYRNKVEFSFGKYISGKEWIHKDFTFWFHKQWEFSKIIDCSYCALADEETNKIFREIDTFARNSWLPTYDQMRQEWFWRHLVVRKTKAKNEIMLIWSINDEYEKFDKTEENKIIEFNKKLAADFPNLKSAYILYNHSKADIVDWEFIHIFGNPSIEETLFDFTFEIQPKSFFQTNSLWAELLYKNAIDLIDWEWDVALDLYAGTWTIGIIISHKFNKIYSVELVAQSSEDGAKNALKNWVKNIEFINAKTEDFLAKFIKDWWKADCLIIDPPRSWMHPNATRDILAFHAKQIIYISCEPSTLARDIDYMLRNSDYEVTDIIPVDMFPHTHHIETIVKLIR